MRLVNGQLNPTMTMRPGETQRWRILNASANVFYRLHLDGHQLHQIAKDGNTLNETWTRDEIVLSPGERAEVLIQAGPAGSYALRTLPIATGFNTQIDATLATLVVDGDAVTPQPLPTTLLPLEDLSTAEIDQRRQITFQFGPPINPPQTIHPIDHQIFDANRDDQTVQLNTTEEWVIRNATSTWHPFHIHINDYQVVAVNGKPVPVRYSEDTTLVPPFGEITMRTRYPRLSGPLGLPLPHPAARGPRHDGYGQGPCLKRLQQPNVLAERASTFDQQAPRYDARVGLPESVGAAVAAAIMACAELQMRRILCWSLEPAPARSACISRACRFATSASIARRRCWTCSALRRVLGSSSLIVADCNQPWPLPDGSAAVVFASRVIHLLDPEHVTRETVRICRSAGYADSGARASRS